MGVHEFLRGRREGLLDTRRSSLTAVELTGEWFLVLGIPTRTPKQIENQGGSKEEAAKGRARGGRPPSRRGGGGVSATRGGGGYIRWHVLSFLFYCVCAVAFSSSLWYISKQPDCLLSTCRMV